MVGKEESDEVKYKDYENQHFRFSSLCNDYVINNIPDFSKLWNDYSKLWIVDIGNYRIIIIRLERIHMFQ